MRIFPILAVLLISLGCRSQVSSRLQETSVCEETLAASQDSNFYLDLKGSDQWSGSLSCPWRSLAFAVTQLQAGDNLLIREGLYRETKALQPNAGAPGKLIHVRPVPGAKVEFRGGLKWVRPKFWLIEGLQVTAEEGPQQAEALLQLYGGESWIVRGHTVSGSQSYADVSISGADGEAEPRNWVFEGNCVHSNRGQHDITQDHNVYINYGRGGGQGIFRRNLVFGAPNGTNVKVGTGDLKRSDPNDILFENNTFADALYNLRIVNGSQAIRLRKNIFHQASYAWPNPKETSNVQGYCSYGAGNAILDNIGSKATVLFNSYEPWGRTSSCTTPVDAQGKAIYGTIDQQANRQIDLNFQNTGSCEAYLSPAEVQGYGYKDELAKPK